MEYLAVAVAVVTVLAAIVALFRWVGKVDENTRATQKLTVAFESFTRDISRKLFDHERRIGRLEGAVTSWEPEL